ncbi:MAG TPA: sugar phosphate isomerase/epimerase family protein [Nitrososphaeraceae archaeon]
MPWKYSITLASFKNLEPIQETLEKLKNQGFDIVEVYGEPDVIDVKGLSHQLDSFSIGVSGITGMWGLSSTESRFRNLVTTNNSLLKAAQNYVKKCVTLCQKLGGKTFNLCLFSEEPLILDSNHKYLLLEEKRKLISPLIESLRELAKYASNYDIDLLIEPLNRYSTPICTNSEDAKYIVKLVDRENVGIMLDTFHMNIEEDSIHDAIVNSNTMLKHVHISDNNRKMPGFAHIDFENVIGALKRIKYSKFLTFEPSVENTHYEDDLKLGLQYLRNLSKN